MVNIVSGMKFSVDSLGIDYSNVFTAFSFTSGLEPNTNILKSDLWATQASSGIVNNTGSFYNYSGTGFFDGNTFIKLNKNYQLNNSTILLSYEKLRHGNEILLSSVTGNIFNNYSGFYVGVNDANKLYLRYWNGVEGLFTFTYSKVLSDKNLIVINRTNSIIKLGHFNNNNFKFETEDFLIFQNNFINSNTLHLGGSPNFINWGENNLLNFSGYIDRFYIFNNTPFVYANKLAQGLYSEPTGYAGEFVQSCYTSGFLSGSGFSYTGITGVLNSGFESGIVTITGYESIISGYSYSGVTGYLKNIIGSYIDNCGINIDIFETIPLSGLINGEIPIKKPLTGIKSITGYISINLTGTISGIENIYVTGTICNSVFNVTGDIIYNYDDNYLSSLSYKEISLLTQTNPNNITPQNNDIIEIYGETYQPKTLEYNKNLTYDNLNSNYFYIDKEFNQNEPLMFGNGQVLIDSGYKLIQEGYDIIRSPNLDYFITGTTIETNKFFGKKDDLFYDYFTGNFYGSKQSGKIITTPNYLDNNYLFFKNGQKLVDINDYYRNPFQTLNYTTARPSDPQVGDTFRYGNDACFTHDSNIYMILAQRFSIPARSGFLYLYTKNIDNNWDLKQVKTNLISNPGFVSTNYNGSIIYVSMFTSSICQILTGDNNNWEIKQTIGLTNPKTNYFGDLVVGLRNPASFPSGQIIFDVYTGNISQPHIFKSSFGLPNFFVPTFTSFVPYDIDKSGTTIAIGNPGIFNSGIVYIYTGNSNNNWGLAQTITGTNNFGTSVNINNDGSVIFISTPSSISIYTGNSMNKWTLNQVIKDDVFINRNVNKMSIDFRGDTLISSTLVSNEYNLYKKNDLNQWLFTQRINNIQKDNFSLPSNPGNRVFLNSSGNLCIFSSDGAYISGISFLSKVEPNKILLIEDIPDEEENYYVIKETPNNFMYHSGNYGSLKLTGVFNHGCSQVYYNGIKQKINNNYIENSNFDLLSGTFNEPNEFQEVIYNNTDDFFV